MECSSNDWNMKEQEITHGTGVSRCARRQGNELRSDLFLDV